MEPNFQLTVAGNEKNDSLLLQQLENFSSFTKCLNDDWRTCGSFGLRWTFHLPYYITLIFFESASASLDGEDCVDSSPSS